MLRGHIASACDVDEHHQVDVPNQVSVFQNDFCFCFLTLASRKLQLLKQVGKGKSLAVQKIVMEAILTVELWSRG